MLWPERLLLVLRPQTHTMFGSEGDRGLMFRVLQYLWDRKTQREADGHDRGRSLTDAKQWDFHR